MCLTCQQCGSYTSESSELNSLANLEMSIDGAKARAHAQAFVNSLSGGPAVAEASAGVGQLGLDADGKPISAGERPLLETPSFFERPRPEHLVHFPPDFVTVPCKPVLFDIARNQVTPPDISGRFKAKRGGLRGYLFGGR